MYCIAQNVGRVAKTLANWLLQSFVEENVKFTMANIGYFSESGIWLGEILVNSIHYAKFAKVFPHQNLMLAMR